MKKGKQTWQRNNGQKQWLMEESLWRAEQCKHKIEKIKAIAKLGKKLDISGGFLIKFCQYVFLLCAFCTT